MPQSALQEPSGVIRRKFSHAVPPSTSHTRIYLIRVSLTPRSESHTYTRVTPVSALRLYYERIQNALTPPKLQTLFFLIL